MADQILSQDEIDALLSAMDSGDIDLAEEAADKSGVSPYDLTAQQHRIISGEFEALELVYDELLKLLRSSLGSTLGKSLEVKLAASEMVKFGVFLQSFSNPTGFAIFSMDPLNGSALLAIEPGLAFSMIDCLFGGTGKPISKIREFTHIEKGVVKKLSLEILGNLEQAWNVVFPVEVGLKKIETRPQFVQLTSPDDVVITIVIGITGEEFNGNIHLCIPYLSLEAVKEDLSFRTLSTTEDSSKWNDQLLRMLQETNVCITVELGKTLHSVGDVLNLQQGDVIKLDSGPQDPVMVRVEHVPKYLGFPGIVKGNRAVEITSILHELRGR